MELLCLGFLIPPPYHLNPCSHLSAEKSWLRKWDFKRPGQHTSSKTLKLVEYVNKRKCWHFLLKYAQYLAGKSFKFEKLVLNYFMLSSRKANCNFLNLTLLFPLLHVLQESNVESLFLQQCKLPVFCSDAVLTQISSSCYSWKALLVKIVSLPSPQCHSGINLCNSHQWQRPVSKAVHKQQYSRETKSTLGVLLSIGKSSWSWEIHPCKT